MNIWKFIKEKLENKQKAILIVVIERIGSSPGKTGYKMLVAEDGSLEGSIGGGVMEVKMVDTARLMLSESVNKTSTKRQVHSPDAKEESSGLMCAGEQTHAFIPLNSSNLSAVNEIIQCLENDERGLLSLSPGGLSFSKGDYNEFSIDSNIENKERWTYSEVIGIKDNLYIFGGGHVSIPVSQVFNMLGFRVSVFDNRENLSTIEKNSFAHKIQLIDYNEAGKYVRDGKSSHVAIMTVSHAEDYIVLKQMITKELGYLGMIGSKNKIKNIFDKLRTDGITQDLLDKVDAPMGLPINSITIQEIAVSIAAKVIKQKNQQSS